MPKLIDALSAMTGEMLPFDSTEELLEELGIGVSMVPWDLLANNGFTYRVINEWWCTDQSVGATAIYHHGELIAMTTKISRRVETVYSWASQDHADRTYNAVMNLAREFQDAPRIRLLAAEETVDTHYRIAYHEQLMPHHLENPVMHHQRLASIVSFEVDPASRYVEYATYRLRYHDDGSEHQGAKLEDMLFPYPWAP